MKRVRVTGKKAQRIKNTGRTEPKVDPVYVAQAIGVDPHSQAMETWRWLLDNVTRTKGYEVHLSVVFRALEAFEREAGLKADIHDLKNVSVTVLAWL